MTFKMYTKVAVIWGLNIAFAIASEVKMLAVDINLQDQTRLQRGAKTFMNYCSGCHSLRYMRYNRMAKDLGLTTFSGKIDENLLFNNLIFTTAQIADPIHIALPQDDARKWFGIVPPDLSLTARERGPNWIYTYLKSFYQDSTRPFGANNLLVPDVAMPNVLEPLIGQVIAIKAKNSNDQAKISHLVLTKPGEMSPREFDSTLTDLVNFLVYVAEPAKLQRYQIGVVVLIFLAILFVLSYKLKKVYWKNIKKDNTPPPEI